MDLASIWDTIFSICSEWDIGVNIGGDMETAFNLGLDIVGRNPTDPNTDGQLRERIDAYTKAANDQLASGKTSGTDTRR